MSKKLIVFAPHPDDETFGCGGTIAKKVSEGYDVLIVVMTDGRYAFLEVLGRDFDPTPEELKEIRIKEVKKAMQILGVPENNLIFLNFVDGTLKDNGKEAEEKVVEILSKYCPDEVYIPYRRDGHSDHRATHRIVKNAIEKLRISPICYQYPITHRFARFGHVVDSLFNFLLKDRKKYVDISKLLHVKKLAIMEFKSELTPISPNHKPIVKDIKKFQRNKEIFYIENIKKRG